MIQLNENLVLSQGKTRRCYIHPDDGSRVIKIALSPSPRDGNQKEWKHYQYLGKRGVGPGFLLPCHGFVSTNMGPGLVFDCLKDHDGGISKTLNGIMETRGEGYDGPGVFEAVRAFCFHLIKENIQFFDLNPGNLAVRVDHMGQYQVFSVDIKGRYDNHELIPVSTYFPYFSRKKLGRRSMILLERLKIALGRPELAL